MTRKELDALRAEIDRIDSEIIDLVAVRNEVSREIALVKRKDHLPIKNGVREREVVARLVREAKTSLVGEKTASSIAESLISESVRIQSDIKATQLKGERALVVGGSGRMGAWVCRFLSNRGAEVRIWDPRGKLAGYKSERSLADYVKRADLVVLASPLGVCADEMDQIIRLKPEGVVFDVCSIKAHVAGGLRKAAKDGLLVTSVHPMFGPNAASPAGKNVLVCDCGSGKANRLVSELFSSAGANVSQVRLERHDELMAYVLGLSHLCILLFASTARRSGVRAKELRRVEGPSLRRLSKMASELSNESRRVYHDIQSLNPNTRGLITSMEAAFADIKKAALSDSPKRFGEIMDSNGDYLEVK
jgi:chorismate mutase/prephenate dehydrogenase